MEPYLILQIVDRYDVVNRVIININGKPLLDIKRSKLIEVFGMNPDSTKNINMEKIILEYTQHRVGIRRGHLPKQKAKRGAMLTINET